jgi:hypothetical protein
MFCFSTPKLHYQHQKRITRPGGRGCGIAMGDERVKWSVVIKALWLKTMTLLAFLMLQTKMLLNWLYEFQPLEYVGNLGLYDIMNKVGGFYMKEYEVLHFHYTVARLSGSDEMVVIFQEGSKEVMERGNTDEVIDSKMGEFLNRQARRGWELKQVLGERMIFERDQQ